MQAFRDLLANLFDQPSISGIAVPRMQLHELPRHVTLDDNMIYKLHNYGLMQHVEEATHTDGNLLDVIVTIDNDAQLVVHGSSSRRISAIIILSYVG
jgi:hypothetical protein